MYNKNICSAEFRGEESITVITLTTITTRTTLTTLTTLTQISTFTILIY